MKDFSCSEAPASFNATTLTWSDALTGRMGTKGRSAVDLEASDTTTRAGGRAAAPPEPGSIDRIACRTLDIVGSAMALLMLAPLLLSIAIAIRVTSPGPALFRQKRYGLHGTTFEVLKFRTMDTSIGDPCGRRQTVRNDPRVTPFGRFLRRTSFDELPQLFNVLRGEMSLVGPRPHVPHMLANGMRYEEFDPRYMARHAVLPGITGLAQVMGFRGETNTEFRARMRLEYDLDYISKRSFWLNVKIIIATIRVEFVGGSGY